jgi:hypothetical protein
MSSDQKKTRKPWSPEAREKQAVLARAFWTKKKALKQAVAVDRDEANCASRSSPATVEELTQSGALALTPTNTVEQPTDSPNNLGQTESSVTATPADGPEAPAFSASRHEPMLESREPKLKLGREAPPPIEGSGTSSNPTDSAAGAVSVLLDATAADLKVDQPEVTPTLTEAEAAQFLDENQPSESVGEPFSTESFNLNYLIATGQVERVELHRYMTPEEAAALKDKYIDNSRIYQNITRSTAGYVNGELVVVWLAPELARFPEAEIKRAERAMKRMRWNKAENSNRSALKASGGRELNFGWRHAFGKIVQFVPTIEQKSNYMEIWPLVDRLDGIFARTLPQIWRSQLLDQRSTGFTKTATAESTFSGITLLGNAPSSAHLDAKNSGFVAMTTAGKFTGGEFLLIEFGLSKNIGTVILTTCKGPGTRSWVFSQRR